MLDPEINTSVKSAAQASTFPSRRLPVGVIAWTAPLLLYYLIQSAVIKAIELRQIQAGAGVGELALAWLPDLQVAFFLFVVFGGLFSLAGRRVRIGGYLLFVAIMVYFIVLNGASYAYFAATGANLSWSTVDYWLSNFAATNQIISAGHKGPAMYFTFGQIILVGILAVIPFVGPVSRLAQWHSTLRLRCVITVLAGGVAIWAGLFPVPALGGTSMALCRSLPLDIVSDFVADKILSQENVAVLDSERADSLLEFTSDPAAPRPNVVFILFESLRWGSSDAYTPGLGTTPFLEELAREGMLVENHYSVVPHTTKAVMAANCGIYPFVRVQPRGVRRIGAYSLT